MTDIPFAIFPNPPDDDPEGAADALERPDFEAVWIEREPEAEDNSYDPITGLPLVSCPVCGVPTYVEGMHDQICSVCGWAQDDSLQDVWEESEENDGMSLMQAQLNFRTFGKIDWQFKGEN